MSDPKYINEMDLRREIRALPDYGELWRKAMKCFLDCIDEVPVVDAVEVVRCADCKYQEKGENECEAWNLCGYRPWLHIPTEDDAFCSKGERKNG